MQTDMAIKVSLSEERHVLAAIDDFLQVEHFEVTDPNISLAKLTRRNGSRTITTSLNAGFGTFLVAARDSELRLEQRGRLLYAGVMIEDSVTYIEETGPISIELPSEACLYVITYLRKGFESPCPVIGGRFNIRDLRLTEILLEAAQGPVGQRGDIVGDFARQAFDLYRRLPRVHPLSAWRLTRVRQYVDNRIEERISLEDLADVAGFSRAHFAATFKAATSMSVHEFILRCRIQMAAKLLTTTELSLVDISLRTGFQNQAHFTTVFRKLTSSTPARWREARRGADVRPMPSTDLPARPTLDRPAPSAACSLNLH